MYIGVDGCRAGWFSVTLGDTPTAAVFHSASSLWSFCRHATRILVDIPIGLSQQPRACDVEARRVLGPKRSASVFMTAPREAIDAPDYPSANAQCRAIRGKGLSKQSWSIAPRIRELDELLRTNPDARRTIRECHPEVCFWGIAGEGIREPKRTPEGYERRVRLLESVVPGVRGYVERWTAEFKGAAAADDVVDALVAAWAAAAPKALIRTLPESPPRDDHQLPMEMVYRLPA